MKMIIFTLLLSILMLMIGFIFGSIMPYYSITNDTLKKSPPSLGKFEVKSNAPSLGNIEVPFEPGDIPIKKNTVNMDNMWKRADNVQFIIYTQSAVFLLGIAFILRFLIKRKWISAIKAIIIFPLILYGPLSIANGYIKNEIYFAYIGILLLLMIPIIIGWTKITSNTSR